ncbi:9506_t:CDS:2, partial [Acaulospora colombiana]
MTAKFDLKIELNRYKDSEGGRNLLPRNEFNIVFAEGGLLKEEIPDGRSFEGQEDPSTIRRLTSVSEIPLYLGYQ